MEPMRDVPGLIRPVQERSRRTLARLVDAALDLIAERGVEATSVHDIVERAESSVGSFYARFGGKDDLVHYLEERVWADARGRWDEGIEAGRWSEATRTEIVAGLVGLVLDVERHGAQQRRALGRQSREGGPADAFYEHIHRGVVELLRPHLADEKALTVVLSALVGAARLRARRLADGAEGGTGGAATHVGDEEFAIELTKMAAAYLFGGGASSPGTDETGGAREAEEGSGGPIDFFDVWG